MAGPAPISLDFYTKRECPLCDEARAAVARVRARLEAVPVEVRFHDIEADPALFETYRYLIPVIELNGERLCLYHVHERRLAKRLRSEWRARVRHAAS